MTIDEMTDQEKSVMLAWVMGWRILDTSHIQDEKGWVEAEFFTMEADFYDPANMVLAWRVLNWASKRLPIYEWWDVQDMPEEEAVDAQRAWLDKILSLAIEAGLVEPADA